MISNECKIETMPSARAVAMRAALDPYIARLAAKPETAGICVLGSFALSGMRPSADIFSDFDIALIIDIALDSHMLSLSPGMFRQAVQPLLPAWLPNFKFVHPDGDPLHEPGAPPLQINVHQLVLAYEEQPNLHWPADRREAFAHTCDIVHDPKGRIAALRAAKSKPPKAELARRLNDNIALIPVTVEHSVEKCIRRGLFADATLALCECIDYLLDLAYAVNDMDLPHRKWRIALLDCPGRLPHGFRSRVEELLASSDAGAGALSKKSEAFLQLFEELVAVARQEHELLHDPYRKLITETRPGFQLRDHTFADGCYSEHEQYEKMKLQEWNLINFEVSS